MSTAPAVVSVSSTTPPPAQRYAELPRGEETLKTVSGLAMVFGDPQPRITAGRANTKQLFKGRNRPTLDGGGQIVFVTDTLRTAANPALLLKLNSCFGSTQPRERSDR